MNLVQRRDIESHTGTKRKLEVKLGAREAWPLVFLYGMDSIVRLLR